MLLPLRHRGYFSLGHDRPLADAFFDHVFDPRSNAGVALHQRVQIVGVEP
jgi:hypothetical protein